MRFLMLNWRDPFHPKAGGAESVTERVLSALAEAGHEVWWFSRAFELEPLLEYCGRIWCPPDARLGGVRIVRSSPAGAASPLLAIRDAIRWHRRHGPFDLVIDQHHGLPWFAPWWCRGPCIAFIHEILGPVWRSFYGPVLQRLGAAQERMMLRAYRRVPFWTVSESTRRGLAQLGIRQIQVWPNGVDVAPLATLPEKRIAGALKLATLSRLAPNKRLDHAILALKLLQDRKLPASLTIIGRGNEMASLRGLARRLNLMGSVSFSGELPAQHRNAAVQEAHLLLHPSVCEGWGLNVIEAAALGTPAVGYHVPGLEDSIAHAQTGLLAAVESPQALADCIWALASNPDLYGRLRYNAWQRAKRFVWSETLPPLITWLEALARRSARSYAAHSRPCRSSASLEPSARVVSAPPIGEKLQVRVNAG